MRLSLRLITTVFGLSNTATSGTPPKLSNPASKLRTSDSTPSFSTTRTSTQREYLSRDTKKWMRSWLPSR
jgi:hypothetical protein